MGQISDTTCVKCGRGYWACLTRQAFRVGLYVHRPQDGRVFRVTAERRERFKREVLEDRPVVLSYYEALNEGKEMKKRAKVETPTPESFKPSTDLFYKKLPNIDEVMNNPWYDDGDPRELGNIKITSTTSGVQLILTDANNEESAFTSAATVREALEALEAALERGSSVWRPWPEWMKKKPALTKKR